MLATGWQCHGGSALLRFAPQFCEWHLSSSAGAEIERHAHTWVSPNGNFSMQLDDKPVDGNTQASLGPMALHPIRFAFVSESSRWPKVGVNGWRALRFQDRVSKWVFKLAGPANSAWPSKHPQTCRKVQHKYYVDHLWAFGIGIVWVNMLFLWVLSSEAQDISKISLSTQPDWLMRPCSGPPWWQIPRTLSWWSWPQAPDQYWFSEDLRDKSGRNAEWLQVVKHDPVDPIFFKGRTCGS